MKSFRSQLSRKDITAYLVLLLLAAGGIWLRGYAGGCITGAAGSMLLVAILGKRLAQKAIRRIDKNVKDILINR